MHLEIQCVCVAVNTNAVHLRSQLWTALLLTPWFVKAVKTLSTALASALRNSPSPLEDSGNVHFHF